MPFQTRPSLIARLRDSDDAMAWREFVTRYEPFICRIGTASGVPGHALADMAQDVLLTVVRVIPRFAYDPSRGRFRAWLARVVRSRCSDWLRRREREAVGQAVLARGCVASGDEPDGDSCSRKTALEQGLQIVRDSTRPSTWECFQKHAVEGLPAAQVAIDLGVSVTSVYLNSMRLMRRVEQESRRIFEGERAHGAEVLSN